MGTNARPDQAMLLAAIDVCPQGVAVLENDRVLYANQAFLTAVGVSNGADLEIRPAEPVTQDLDYIRQWVPRLRSEPDRGRIEADDVHGVHLVLLPPTKRFKASARPPLQSQATEAVRLVSAGIAHDVNNILTAVLLYSGLLVASLELDPKLQHYAESIHKAGTSGLALVAELMNPLRNGTVENPRLSWNQVVSDMKTYLARLVGEKIQVRAKLARTVGSVRADANSAHQILVNLVSNARDAMPVGGTLVISTRNRSLRLQHTSHRSDRARCVCLSVKDTGTGMDKTTLRQVFRPFFTTKPSMLGTGLGLTIVRDIVRRLGGEVVIASKLGQGTEVKVLLPEAQE